MFYFHFLSSSSSSHNVTELKNQILGHKRAYSPALWFTEMKKQDCFQHWGILDRKDTYCTKDYYYQGSQLVTIFLVLSWEEVRKFTSKACPVIFHIFEQLTSPVVTSLFLFLLIKFKKTEIWLQFESTELYFARLLLNHCVCVTIDIYLTFEEQIGPPFIPWLMLCLEICSKTHPLFQVIWAVYQ